jgi:uncharacterized membrane protein YgdD (TMEM256/DUF423 family)
MDRMLLAIGSLSAALAVACGAFGAHALEARLSPDRLATWDLAGRYHLSHSLAIVLAALAAGLWPESPWPTRAAWAFLAGSVFFSGSLYLLALSGIRWLGAITPIGGVLFIGGWILLALAAR